MATAPTQFIQEDPSFRDGTAMQWVVHVVTVRRRHCVIAMHVGSRYAIVMMGVKKGHFKGFVDAFCHRLINEMFFLCSGEGLVAVDKAALVAENFVDKHSDVLVYRRSDRSVLGHIKEVVLSLEYEAESQGALPDGPDEAFEFGTHVNAMLRKTKEMRDYFYPFEVMRDSWFIDVCAEIVDPEVLDRMEEGGALPDNVIVLADYRRSR